MAVVQMKKSLTLKEIFKIMEEWADEKFITQGILFSLKEKMKLKANEKWKTK